jgi:hypothetical protein
MKCDVYPVVLFVRCATIAIALVVVALCAWEAVVGAHGFRRCIAHALWGARPLETPRFPIDAIVAWVDTADPAFQRARERARGGAVQCDVDMSSGRENALGELELNLCIRLALRNMPWLRRVYVLTGHGQRPRSLDGCFRSLVDTRRVVHVTQESIGAAGLFNSVGVEAHIHHIPGLAEHFLYMNDDMYVTRPVHAGALFASDGRPIARGCVLRRALAVDQYMRSFQELQKAMGRTMGARGQLGFVLPQHVIVPLSKNLLQTARAKFPREFRAAAKAAHRDTTPNPLALAVNYGMLTGRCYFVEGTDRGCTAHMDTYIAHTPFGVAAFVPERSEAALVCLNVQDVTVLRRLHAAHFSLGAGRNPGR